MDLFDRRIIGRLARQLPLAGGEELLDFEIGTSRPFGLLPPPFPHDFPENARVEVAVSDRALYFRVESKSFKGETARVPWDRVASFGPYKAEGKWRRWSLRGSLANGEALQVTLTGRPRPSMVAALAALVDPS